MRYLKITKENVNSLLVDGVILAHCKEILSENELHEITEDITIDIDTGIDSTGVTIIKPDGSDTPRREIDYFTDGHWWLKDFSEVEYQTNKNGKYVILICSTTLLLLSIYMFAGNVSLSGYYGPGRGGGGVTKGSISAPFVMLFGLMLLGAYIGIVRGSRANNK